MVMKRAVLRLRSISRQMKAISATKVDASVWASGAAVYTCYGGEGNEQLDESLSCCPDVAEPLPHNDEEEVAACLASMGNKK